ncbi:hypothetical protein ABT095_20405 [Kitasatospora sp. NPDC002227]|uniref:hypothetical protein n=1 Tax=Kitasatospora sp. NPDC002227 TaxID=3154773 RepID=UPI00331CF4A7
MDDLDRPTISAARLEELFGGVREELTTGLVLPSADRLARRAARRRRLRRAGVSAVTGVVAFSLLLGWSLFSGGSGDGLSVAGQASEQTLAPILELPGPLPLPSDSPVSLSHGSQGDLLGQEGFGLLLPTEQMPSVRGLYGPWTRVTENPRAVMAASASSSPSPGSSQKPTSLSEGCGPALVQQAGEVRYWEFRYTDVAGHGAFAQQYVLEFDSPESAVAGADRIRTAGLCTTDGSGWTLEDQAPGEVAVQLPSDRSLIEEIGAQPIGSQVVVLMVEQATDRPQADVHVQGEFRNAVQKVADQAASSPSQSPSGGASSDPSPSGKPKPGQPPG